MNLLMSRSTRLGLGLFGALLAVLLWADWSRAAKSEDPCSLACSDEGRICMRAAIDVKRGCYSACSTDESPTECREPCRSEFDAAHDACRDALGACRDVCNPPPCKKLCSGARKDCMREALGGEDEVGCRKKCKAENPEGDVGPCVKDCRQANKAARSTCKTVYKDCKQTCGD